jgi:hypothetical protein
MAKHRPNICLIIALIAACWSQQLGAFEPLPFGVISGPKAAFQIKAPNGWVLDNHSGQRNKMPYVMYPVGSSWRDGKVTMCAALANPEYRDYGQFAEDLRLDYKRQGAGYWFKRVKSGNTSKGYPYFVDEYKGRSDPEIHRTAYIQLPNAVAFIQLAASDEQLYRRHAPALDITLESVEYAPRFIGRHQ